VLQPPATRRAVLDLLPIGFARLFVIEEDPSVAPLGPPELSPQFVRPHGQYSVATLAFPLVVSTSWIGGLIVTRITRTE
jgi:hypothetical protein